MPDHPMMALRKPILTIIVAATRSMGIGLRGSLPWQGLKNEMAYFARVTSMSPGLGEVNAVIMGRKTWQSIPPRFRPLKNRVNVVISRNPAADLGRGGAQFCGPHVAGSLEAAVELLGGEFSTESIGGVDSEGQKLRIGKIFVIGGAELYKAALSLRETRRILLTRIRSDMECDTFFPLDLHGQQQQQQQQQGQDGNPEEAESSRWIEMSQDELEAFAGVEVPRGVQLEANIQYEFTMYERVDAGICPTT
ncbi:MAG: dihydrofolate reductase [Trichoglossum hirsutum]|nr:MAG: dihydrofolate reductase [Trichoglossum hirsutum]